MASSAADRASLELDPLSKTQNARIDHIIDKMLSDTNNKASQHHGESRHAQKETNIKKGAKGSAEINAGTSKAESTEDKYKSCMHGLMAWSYQIHSIKDPMQIKPEHIKEFFSRLIDNGFSRNTYEGYTKALAFWGAGEKSVLAQYSRIHGGNYNPNWEKGALKEMRKLKDCCADKEHRRAYDNPHAIIDNLHGAALIGARLQYENGMRIADVCQIRRENWDIQKGEGVANSKGGQAFHFKPSPEVARAITSAIKNHGSFSISPRQYVAELREAVNKSGQVWEGSHGLRAAFAEANMIRCQKAGMSYKAALIDTGRRLGHHRPASEVTKTYIKGISPW